MNEHDRHNARAGAEEASHAAGASRDTRASHAAAAPYTELAGVLSRARRRLAITTLAGGVIRWLCVAGGGLAVALALAAILPPSVPGALTISLAWLSLAITSLGAFIVLPLARLPGVDAVAVRLDDVLEPGSNFLISSLQLGRKLSEGREVRWVSGPIAARAVEAGAAAARRLDPGPVTSDPERGKWVRQLLIVATFSVAMAVLWPGEIKTSVWMLANPMACGPVPISLSVAPGDVELDAGEDLVVEAVVTGTDKAAELHVRRKGGVWKRMAMVGRHTSAAYTPGDFVVAPTDLAPAGDASATVRTPAGLRELPRRRYLLTLKNLQEDREYKVHVADRTSPTWSIQVNQPPRAVAFKMSYTFPDYTGLPRHENVSASGDVAALKGATVELEVSANRVLAGARLDFESGRTLGMTPKAEKSFSGAFRVMEDDRYTITFIDGGGGERRDPRSFKVTPLPDRSPMVRIVSPGPSMDLPSSMKVDVSAYAADDYGISSMALVYFLEGGEESHLPLKTYTEAPRELYESYEWDLTELGLLPGEVVYYAVEVRDNDAVSGPKTRRSEVHSMRFPTMAEIYEQAGEDYEEGIGNLTDQLREGRKLKKKLEEVSRELKSGDNLSWEQRQSVKGAVSDVEEIEKAAQQMAESLDQIVNKMGGSELMDEEVVEKIKEIQKLLSQISDPDIKKAIEQLNEALANVDKDAIAKAMEKMKLNQENLLKKLDRTIELLKKLQAEEQMRAAQKKIEDLLKKQEGINGSLGKDNPNAKDLERLADEEGGVKKGLGELEISLKTAQKMLQGVDPKAAGEMGERAKQASAEGLQKDAQEAAQQMKGGSCNGAMRAGGKVSKGLASMSKKMQMTMQSMQQRQAREIAQKLDAAAKDLVFLSKGQEGMVTSAGASPPQDLARSQFQLHSGAAQVADGLEEVIRSSFSLSRRLAQDLGDALQKMEAATENFEAGRKQVGLADSWKAVPSLNKAAMQLMKASKDMMSMPASSCSSPSGQRAGMQKMQGLCNMQRGVNQSTQGLLQRMQQEGGRLRQSTEDELARLAARQEMIRKGMEEVSGEIGDRKDVLGRIDQLAEEMQKVIDDMEKKNVDRKTIRRQQRILSRLLDAQRSVRRRDTKEERVSRVGVDRADRLSPGALPPELLNARDRIESEVLQGKADPVPPAYRRLVEEYFRAISTKGF